MSKKPRRFILDYSSKESSEEETERYKTPPYSKRLLRWINTYYLPNQKDQDKD